MLGVHFHRGTEAHGMLGVNLESIKDVFAPDYLASAPPAVLEESETLMQRASFTENIRLKFN